MVWVSQLALAVSGTIACTYLYNSQLKALFIGPLLMGLCRVLNGFIGASIVANPFMYEYTQMLSPVLALVFVHVVLLTWIARFETHKRIPSIVKWFVVLHVFVGCVPPLLVLVFEPYLTMGWSSS